MQFEAEGQPQLQESEIFSAQRISLLVRSGSHFLRHHWEELAAATNRGSSLRVVVFNPESVAFATAGAPLTNYLATARDLPQWIQALERAASPANLEVRATDYLPPFSMLIGENHGHEPTTIKVQLNYTYSSRLGRPSVVVSGKSPWVESFLEEFNSTWAASRAVDSTKLSASIQMLEKRESDFRNEPRFLGSCAFCQIPVEQDIMTTSLSRVVANRRPIVEGHSLVIPRRHVNRLEEMDRFEVMELFDTANVFTEKIRRITGASGVNWAMQDGRSAGQTVPHFHLHVIPRMGGDMSEPGAWPSAIDSSDRPQLTWPEYSRTIERPKVGPSSRGHLPRLLGGGDALGLFD